MGCVSLGWRHSTVSILFLCVFFLPNSYPSKCSIPGVPQTGPVGQLLLHESNPYCSTPRRPLPFPVSRVWLPPLNRSGEDNAVSRVVLQAIAESVGVTVPRQFKRHHLFLDPRGHVGAAAGDGAVSEAAGASGQESALEGEEDGEGGVMEVMPVAELSPECDAIEDLVSGRSSAMMIVPRGPPGVSTTRGGSGSGSGKSSNAGTSGAAAPEDFPENLGSRPEGRSKAAAETAAVVLQDYAVKAALPRGATVVLPGSYNPLHKGHLGLLEAARRSLSDKLQAEAVTAGATAAAAAAATAAGHSGGHKSGSVGEGRKSWAAAVTPAPGVGVSTTVHAVFELSVANADKGGLPAEEVRRRARQFCEERGVGWPHPLIISRAPLFSQKVGGGGGLYYTTGPRGVHAGRQVV